MSFLTDLFEGNIGNLGHDLTAHLSQDLPLELAAITAPFAAFGLPEMLGGAGFGAGGLFGGAGGLGGLFGGGAAAADAGAGLAGAAGDVAGGATAADTAIGGGALGLTGADSFASAPGIQAIDASMVTPGAPAGNVGAGLTGDASGIVGGAGGTSPGAGGGGFLDKLISGATSSLTKNPLGIAAAGAGLGLSALRGSQDSANMNALKEQASQLGAQGQQLMSYLSGGTLPPALQAQLNQATQAAKARIISNHAANGMSTDPSQNSALAQELNAVDTNAVAAMATTQIQMMQTGLSETGLSTQLYSLLTQMDRADNTALMNSIASFAGALGGGAGKGVTLQVAK